MSRDVILTREGLEKLTAELETLETTGRREVAERIKEARDFGDISENSEYDDAKNEQAQIEARIIQLQDRIRSATIVDHDDVQTDTVQVGATVTFKNETTGKTESFTIVGSAEASASEGRISNESPVGKALLGKKKGADVNVNLPNGKSIKLTINKIDVGI